MKEIHLQCILADSNINFQLEERQFFNLVTFLYYSNIYIPDLESFSISERKLEQTLGGRGISISNMYSTATILPHAKYKHTYAPHRTALLQRYFYFEFKGIGA